MAGPAVCWAPSAGQEARRLPLPLNTGARRNPRAESFACPGAVNQRHVPASLERQVRAAPGSLVLQVTNAKDVAAVGSVLSRTAQDFTANWALYAREAGVPVDEEIGGPKSWAIVQAPRGPTLVMDCHDISADVVLLLPERLFQALEAAGESSAWVMRPAEQHLPAGIQDMKGVETVSLRAFADGPFGPDAFTDQVRKSLGHWLAEGRSVDEALWAAIGSVDIPTTLRDIDGLLAISDDARATFVVGREETGLRYGEWVRHLLLAEGGSGFTTADLLKSFELLVTTARSMASAVAQISIDFGTKFTGFHTSEWDRDPDRASVSAIANIPSRAVQWPAPYLLLSSNHVERLGRRARRLRQEIDQARFELRIGEPADWLPRSTKRRKVTKESLRLLKPLLISADTAYRETVAAMSASADGQPSAHQPDERRGRRG
jgi:hypothetical protein